LPLFPVDSRNGNDGQKEDEQQKWGAAGADFEGAREGRH
jgi:hypothetical protein